MGYFEKHNCKHIEDLPKEDKDGGWNDPTETRKFYNKKKPASVKKALKARSTKTTVKKKAKKKTND